MTPGTPIAAFVKLRQRRAAQHQPAGDVDGDEPHFIAFTNGLESIKRRTRDTKQNDGEKDGCLGNLVRIYWHQRSRYNDARGEFRFHSRL